MWIKRIMPNLRARPLLAIASLCAMLTACTTFPELEVSEAQFDSKTPYPELVPVAVLLKEPEATITDEVEGELTARREDLQSTPSASANPENDPILDRVDALRERTKTKAGNGSLFSDDLRKRLEGGITVPTAPE